MANILIIQSSFRNKSNSTALAAAIAEGAQANGHIVTREDIARLRIEPCRGCGACLLPEAKSCIIQDDMQALYPKVREADIILYASPVYWFNLCGQIKQFIDRCFAVAARHDENGTGLFAGKKLGLVLAFGGEDAYLSGAVNAIRSIEDVCRFTGARWAGAVYGSANEPGEMMTTTHQLEKARQFGESL